MVKCAGHHDEWIEMRRYIGLEDLRQTPPHGHRRRHHQQVEGGAGRDHGIASNRLTRCPPRTPRSKTWPGVCRSVVGLPRAAVRLRDAAV